MPTIADILHEERVSLQSHADGKRYTVCPMCSAARKKHNRRKHCLRVEIDGRGVRLTCFHCSWFKARFYDEGTNDAGKAATLHRARKVAGGRSRDPLRVGGGDGGRIPRREPSIRVPSERRVVLPEVPTRNRGGGRCHEETLDRPRGCRTVLLERGLPER